MMIRKATGGNIEVPSLIGTTKEDAENTIKNAGLTCRFVGDGDKVTDQVPTSRRQDPVREQGHFVPRRKKSSEMITVPNVLGEHPSTAKDRLENNSLYMRRTGIKTSQTNGGTIAVQQNPAAGTEVPIRTVIQSRLRTALASATADLEEQRRRS